MCPRKPAVFKMATSPTHPLLKALGGPLGIAEAIVPPMLFVVLFALSAQSNDFPFAAIVLSGFSTIVFIGIRIVRRESLVQALAGFLAVIASIVLALTSGKAENNFLIGIITNAVYGFVFLVSVGIRWPLVGVAVGIFSKRGQGWRSNKAESRLFTWLTLMWVVMFIVRVSVELPLYISENVAGLAVAKIALGLPVYVPVIVATWLFVRGMFVEESTHSEEKNVS